MRGVLDRSRDAAGAKNRLTPRQVALGTSNPGGSDTTAVFKFVLGAYAIVPEHPLRIQS